MTLGKVIRNATVGAAIGAGATALVIYGWFNPMPTVYVLDINRDTHPDLYVKTQHGWWGREGRELIASRDIGEEKPIWQRTLLTPELEKEIEQQIALGGYQP